MREEGGNSHHEIERKHGEDQAPAAEHFRNNLDRRDASEKTFSKKLYR
jgi:hypothetical protein